MKKLLITTVAVLITTMCYSQKATPAKKSEDHCNYPTPLPADISDSVHYAISLYVGNKLADCIAIYGRMIAKYPDYCIGYYNRGLARFYNGDKQGAREDFEKATSLGLLDTKELIKRLYEQ
jgi:hypothetical protein